MGTRLDAEAGGATREELAAERRCEAEGMEKWVDLEDMAARTVAAVLDADYELNDIPGRSGAYDYTIRRGDELTALEVTQATDFATERFYGALAKHGEHFDAPGLKRHWMVAVEAPDADFRARDMKRLQQDLLSMISALEAEDRERFECHGPSDVERQVCDTYNFVRFGNTVDMDGSPEIWLNHSPVVAFASDDLIVVAERHAALDDNRAKLAASRFEHRHLFVWINIWELEAAAAFGTGTPPDRAPRLPDEINHLWIGRIVDGRVDVWHFGDGRWEFHQITTNPGPV